MIIPQRSRFAARSISYRSTRRRRRSSWIVSVSSLSVLAVQPTTQSWASLVPRQHHYKYSISYTNSCRYFSDKVVAMPTTSPAKAATAVTHLPKEILPDWMLEGRTKILVGDSSSIKMKFATQQASSSSKPSSSIIYVMQRDVRTKDNWALLLATHFAQQHNLILRVVYALPPTPSPQPVESIANDDTSLPINDLKNLPMTERHGKFLLGGLFGVHSELKARNIPLHILMPSSHETVGATIFQQAIQKHDCKMVIVDFSPLRHLREYTELQLATLLLRDGANNSIPLVQVDAHNIVPVWIASDKREYGARTIRPKIHRLLDQYLHKNHFPRFKDFTLTANNAGLELPEFQQTLYEDFMKMDGDVKELDWAKPGTDAALTQAEQFFSNGLKQYDKLRNDPNYQRTICSTLSPWLNHGHVSFQRIALAVQKLNKYPDGTKAFLEEGIIRKELSDNFLYYTPDSYDSLTCAYDWAQETLTVHSADQREYVYTCRELELAETHDDLWNAAQLQAVRHGKMHGFLRMYWAKKILEWTESPDAALKIAQYLNDKFNIDGRDPNGFVGVGWSIMGLHDQGWKERNVFGKIRYMNYAGCQRKFKVQEFVAKFKGAAENAVKAHRKHSSKRPANKTSSSSADGKQSKKTKKTT